MLGAKECALAQGALENWYVIAIPKIDLPATFVLDPGIGFSFELSMDTGVCCQTLS